MRIALVTLVEWKADTPPLGAAAINAVLKSRGFETDFIMEYAGTDENVLSVIIGERAANSHLANIDRIVERILAGDPDIVGFSCYVGNRKSVREIALRLRKLKPSLLLIAGGPDIHPTLYEEGGFHIHGKTMDYLVQGEGERRVIEFLNALSQGKQADKITGVYDCSFMEKYKNLYSGYCDFIHDLNNLPFADFGEDPPFEIFKDKHRWWTGFPLYMTRGCTGNCSFCGRREYYKGYNVRSAEHIFAEMQSHIKKYNPDKFIIIDDDPLSNRALGEMEKLCRLMIENGSKIKWNIYNARISKRIADPDWAKLLKKAGLEFIQFGIESLSPSVRKHMGKPIDPKIVDAVITNFTNEGILTWIYIIYGYPTETDADFQATFDWLKENCNKLEVINVNNFIMNDAYSQKRPGSFELIEPSADNALSFWKSEHVNQEVLWERFYRLKYILEDIYKNYYYISDPSGLYYYRQP